MTPVSDEWADDRAAAELVAAIPLQDLIAGYAAELAGKPPGNLFSITLAGVERHGMVSFDLRVPCRISFSDIGRSL